jgi:deoxycytidylate deaminase
MTITETVALEWAVAATKNSPCRSKRGVVIWNNGRFVSRGWNDQPRGFVCDGSELCKATCGKTAVHAEQMALVAGNGSQFLGSELLHVKTVNGVAVPSGKPSCLECSKLILCSGISAIWLLHVGGLRKYLAAEFHRLTLENHASKGHLYWIEKGN